MVATPQSEPLTLDYLTRPRTRAECVDGPRPCPWVSCRHHLALDVHNKGIKFNLSEEPDEWPDDVKTCSLDVAESPATSNRTSDGPQHVNSQPHLDLRQIGELMGVSHEYIRQMETRALEKLRQHGIILQHGRDNGFDLTGAWKPKPKPTKPEDPRVIFGHAWLARSYSLVLAARETAAQTVRHVDPATFDLATLEAELAAKRGDGPAPVKRRRFNKRENTEVARQRAAEATKSTARIATATAKMEPEPTVQATQPTEKTKQKMRFNQEAVRQAGMRAGYRLFDTMTARGLDRKDMEALLQKAHPDIGRVSIEAALSQIVNGSKSQSIWWRRAASVLGLALSDLCDDPEWLAAIALRESEQKPRAKTLVERGHATQPGASPPTPTRPMAGILAGVRARVDELCEKVEVILAENERLKRELAEATAKLQKIMEAIR